MLHTHDLELIFDTIVNERVDAGSQSALAESSLTFDEWKKSMVRIASLCAAQTVRVHMDSGEKQMISLKKKTADPADRI